MAWTTSDNLRDVFGARQVPIPARSISAALPIRRLVRHAAVLGLVVAHLWLLGDLAATPDAARPATMTPPPFGVSLSWLTLTGMMLAILLLAQDWPSATTAVEGVSTTVGDVATVAPSAIATTPASPTFAPPPPTLPPQTRAEPMTGLLARVSHDLRTPLNAVMGFSDLMQQEAFGPLGNVRYQSYARHIHASSAELLKATEDTLAMTSLVANPSLAASETVELSGLVTEAFNLALIGAPKPLAPDRGYLPTPIVLALTMSHQLRVSCERRALRQAMINLLAAAISQLGKSRTMTRSVDVAATTVNDIVQLTITVALDHQTTAAPTLASSWTSAEDLPICLARALLELQGLDLTVQTSPRQWSAQIVMDGVSQRDFFTA